MPGSGFQGVLERCVARVDLPIVARLHEAWMVGDQAAVDTWTATLLACRETAELREEDRQPARPWRA